MLVLVTLDCGLQLQLVTLNNILFSAVQFQELPTDLGEYSSIQHVSGSYWKQ